MARPRRGHRGPELGQRAGSRVSIETKMPISDYFINFENFSVFFKSSFCKNHTHSCISCTEQTFLKENLIFQITLLVLKILLKLS
jgi:hypothetical protein